MYVCSGIPPTHSVQYFSDQTSLVYPASSGLLNNWWNKVYWLWAHLFMGGLAPRSRAFPSFNYSGKWCHSKQEMLLFNTCCRGPWQHSLSDTGKGIHPHSTLRCLHATLTALYCCVSLLMPVSLYTGFLACHAHGYEVWHCDFQTEAADTKTFPFISINVHSYLNLTTCMLLNKIYK